MQTCERLKQFYMADEVFADDIVDSYGVPIQSWRVAYANAIKDEFGEWNPTMLLSRTIVPWASEWLLFYELWVITGVWLGGGIEHSRK